jgi:hypothetical protein
MGDTDMALATAHAIIVQDPGDAAAKKVIAAHAMLPDTVLEVLEGVKPHIGSHKQFALTELRMKLQQQAFERVLPLVVGTIVPPADDGSVPDTSNLWDVQDGVTLELRQLDWEPLLAAVRSHVVQAC